MTTDERALIVALLRQIHELRAGQDALTRLLVEKMPSAAEGVAFLKEYESRKAQIGEDILLKLENSFPTLAAELDELRPLLPPDEAI